MKILYLCGDSGIPVLGCKGASIHIREMVTAFARAGHQVQLAAPSLNRSPWEKPAGLDVPVVQIRPNPASITAVAALKNFNETVGAENPLPSELRRILFNRECHAELKKRYEGGPPDFIYERASLYGTAGVTLARDFKIPLLMELNAPLAGEQKAYRATGLGELAVRAEAWALSQADAVLTVSEPLRKHALSLGATASQVHVFPNGVDSGAFRPGAPDPAVRARWGLGDGPVVGFVGGLRPWHGTEILPGLMRLLLTKHPATRLLIVGDGQLRGELESQFKRARLQEQVVFTGAMAHEEIPSLIRQFTVALAPYPRLDHAFYFSPLKLFEYMACGIPVVASNSGQIREVIRHGKNGFLCRAGDAKAIASACDRLISDSALRTRLGRNAAKLIHSRYTWDQNVRRAIQLVQSLPRGRQEV